MYKREGKWYMYKKGVVPCLPFQQLRRNCQRIEKIAKTTMPPASKKT